MVTIIFWRLENNHPWNSFKRLHLGDCRPLLHVCGTARVSPESRQRMELSPHQPQIKEQGDVSSVEPLGAARHFHPEECLGLEALPVLQGTELCFSQFSVSTSFSGMSSVHRAAGATLDTLALFTFFLFILGPRWWCHWTSISLHLFQFHCIFFHLKLILCGELLYV